MRETGTTTAGIMSVRGFLRKTNTTIITRPIDTISVRSTSLTDARMVVVWSVTTVSSIAEGIDAFNSGSARQAPKRVSMIFAPVGRKMTTGAQGFPFGGPADLRFS